MKQTEEGIEQADMVAFMELLYRAGYRLNRRNVTVEPGYEYAIQQLCSELSLMGETTEDESSRAMQAAQEHVFGAARGKDSRPLSEFGLLVADSDGPEADQ